MKLFDNICKSKKGSSLLQQTLHIVSEKSQSDNLNQMLIYFYEALTLSIHKFLSTMEDTSKYWSEIATIKYDDQISPANNENLSKEFVKILELRKGHRANKTETFIELAGDGFADFKTLLKKLASNGENRKMKRKGETLSTSNFAFPANPLTYIVRLANYESCFPLTSTIELISEHSRIFSNNNAVVIYPTEQEFEVIKSGYNEEVQIIDLEKIMIKNTMSTLAEFSNKVKEVTSAQKTRILNMNS